MLKQVTTILYSVDALDDNARSVAIGELQDSCYNTDHDWEEQPIEHFKEALGMLGITAHDVNYNANADVGVNFVGTYNSGNMDCVKLAVEYPEVYKLIKAIDNPVGKLETTATARIYYKNSRYGGKSSVAVDDVSLVGNPDYDLSALEYERDNLDYASWETQEQALAAKALITAKISNAEDAIAIVSEYITTVKDTMCDYALGELKSVFDYLCTDGAVIETMRCEKMLFLVDGTRAPDYLTQDAVDVLEFENMVSCNGEALGYKCTEDSQFVYTIESGEFIGTGEPCFEVSVTIVNGGSWVTDKTFTSETEAKLWAAKYSLGERS